MKAVLDTNVIISGLLIPDSVPGQVLKAWLAMSFIAVLSPEILEEVRSVLRRPQFLRRLGWDAHRVDAFIKDLGETAEVVSPGVSINVIRDSTDDKFVEAAAESQAEYVVTGDRDLLILGSYGVTRMVTPAQFLGILELETP